ncbi:MAG: hypothetical protein COA94_08225 [Rickettsiales bacterium]|nr:MAG: hypothetical protein COA94_08225 [Rickettsiales bacterium]
MCGPKQIELMVGEKDNHILICQDCDAGCEHGCRGNTKSCKPDSTKTPADADFLSAHCATGKKVEKFPRRFKKNNRGPMPADQ